MTQEEKAQAYDKAIEKAKKHYEECKMRGNDWFVEDMEDMFPELVESDDDEKIRKALLVEFTHLQSNGYKFAGLEGEKIVAWFEKQGKKKPVISDDALREGIAHFGITQYQVTNWLKKYVDVEKQDEQEQWDSVEPISEEDKLHLIFDEQNPVDKVEPKFNVGDKIKLAKEPKYSGREIIDIQNGAYYFDKLVHLPFSRQDEWELVEQKPVDEVEPKFKVGDWVVRGNITAQILDVQEQYYVGIDTNGNDFTSSRFLSDDKIHLWSIKDVKNGDILVDEDNNIGIYQGKVDDVDWHSYIYLGCDNYLRGSGYHIIKNTKPATKEQRDQLEKAIADADFTFDFEKKELKKVEHNSVWSEEDEKLMRFVIGSLNANISDLNFKNIRIWLESLKDRVQPQPKQEWSEEDEQMMNSFLHKVEVCNLLTNKENVWIINKLKSLKHQNTWKPSDEQMDALNDVISSRDIKYDVLSELWKDLKKLKE